MDLQTRKINFVQEFLKLQNEELISNLESLLKKEKTVKNKLKPLSMDEFNARIDESLSDSRQGKLTGTDDLISEIEGWQYEYSGPIFDTRQNSVKIKRKK